MPKPTAAAAALTAPAAKPLDVDTLWRLQRVGGLCLSPDGRQAVCSVGSYDMKANRGTTALWLLPTDRCAPRKLTSCGDKDGQPAWSPQGDQIAFVARREQGGRKDKTPQLYTLPAAGGEAVRRSDFAPGIEAFKWLPDGSGIVFSAWVWPGLKGAAAQARAQKAHDERKDSGYATSEAFYRYWDRNLPQGRVLHLLRLELASGRITDLFEGTALELPRQGGGSELFDVHPGGRHIAFAHDPAAVQVLGQPCVVSEMDLRTRRLTRLAERQGWDFGAPSYSPDGRRVALIAAHVGPHHQAPSQLAVLARGQRFAPTAVRAPAWDHEVNAPLRWAADGQSLLFTAEARGRCPLWRCHLADDRIERVVSGGWVQGFGLAGPTLATLADGHSHPARVHVHPAGAQPLRLERFNDELLAPVTMGQVQEVELHGAQGDPLQMWLTFPPGFEARRKHPVLHVIHGGPHAAAGDTFSYRWNAHMLASQGHVVAQLNYHGSSGFGLEFKRSLVGRQGELELQDIEAATDWLLARPWADRRRVFATGGSYGGFLVAWMNGHVAPGRYRAYVCHAGVFDRTATFSADSYPVRPKDLAARYWEDMPHVLAQSPHASAAALRTPTLVIHGAQDFRVPDCNGLAYYNTLKALGVEARLLWFPDENHWVLKPQNSAQWYAEFLAWLKQHDLPARPAPTPRAKTKVTP
jgi:dipeptidyl aminopeptidase/acylaminoacyl peptidase